MLLREAIVGLLLWTGAAEVAKVRLALHLTAMFRNVSLDAQVRIDASHDLESDTDGKHAAVSRGNLLQQSYACRLWLGPMVVAYDLMRFQAQHMREQQ